MPYLVLLRQGFSTFHVVMKVNRSEQGEVSCTETVRGWAGMSWAMDGSFRLSEVEGFASIAKRTPLARLKEPEIAYSIPGSKLLDASVPYDASLQGATVQINAHAAIEEPDRVALHLMVVPPGEQPYHRETVGDRCIDAGEPDIWIVLARFGGDPNRMLVINRVPVWPPPLRVSVNP